MQSAGKCLPPLNDCRSADIAVSCGVSAMVTTCPLLQCWDLPYHRPTLLCGKWAKLMQCGLGIFREVCPYSIQPQSSNWLFWNLDLTPEIPERIRVVSNESTIFFLPTGWVRWSFNTIQHWWGHKWRTVFSSGLHRTRETWTYFSVFTHRQHGENLMTVPRLLFFL